MLQNRIARLFCVLNRSSLLQALDHCHRGRSSPVVGCNRRPLSTSIEEAEYDEHAESTLQKLSSYLEAFPEWLPCHSDFDITYSMGVLTARIDPKVGTYVINKQTPNRQIWLSSPISGPKRYDWLRHRWIYSHDSRSIDDLLNEEFRSHFCDQRIDFSKHV